MDQDLKKFIAMVKDDPMMPIRTKWLQIQKKLQENGLTYQQTLKPTQLLVHPLNRIGAMLSHHDCHQKGAKILATGPDPSQCGHRTVQPHGEEEKADCCQ